MSAGGKIDLKNYEEIRLLYLEKGFRYKSEFCECQKFNKKDSVSWTARCVKNNVKYHIKYASEIKDNAAELCNRGDIIREFISAPLWNLWLKQSSSPIISIFIKDKKSKITPKKSNHIYIIIKYLDNFSSLRNNFLYRENFITYNSEKIWAAILISGEIDPNYDNLGMELHTKKALKIDHGLSLKRFYKSESEARELLHEAIFRYYRYSSNYFIKLNLNRLKRYLDQMIMESTDETIENIIKNRIHIVSELGVSLEDPFSVGISEQAARETYWFRNLNDEISFVTAKETDIEKKLDIEEQVSIHFIEKLKKQREIMRDLVKTLDIIDKFDMTEYWKDGEWLRDIKGSDPIKWYEKHKECRDRWVEAINSEKRSKAIEI